MYNSQKGNAYIKAYGSTQDLETAAAVFKFAADNTSVEWQLDVYDDNSIKTVVVTDKSEYYVNGTYAQKQLQIEGERIIDIHSHFREVPNEEPGMILIWPNLNVKMLFTLEIAERRECYMSIITKSRR